MILLLAFSFPQIRSGLEVGAGYKQSKMLSGCLVLDSCGSGQGGELRRGTSKRVLCGDKTVLYLNCSCGYMNLSM